MKRLNFYPYYETHLRSREKTTTLRLANHMPFSPGDKVTLTLGWDEGQAVQLHGARITAVYRRRVCDLSESDLDGESPDCKSPQASRLVLSAIYRTVLREDDEVWVVKFEHVQ